MTRLAEGAREMVHGEGRPTVSVVVPVHNERETLAELYERLTDALRSEGRAYELLFVDDGSTDGSTEVLRDLAHGDPAVRVVVLARRFGQLAATLCGLARARGGSVVTIDADLQHPPEAAPRLVAALADGYDVVVAVREGVGRPGTVSRAGRWLLRWLFGVKVPRDLSTFRAFSGSVARRLAACGAEVVLLGAEVCRVGARIGYVPAKVGRRERGKGKYTQRLKFGIWLRAVAAYGWLPWQALLFPLTWCFPRAADGGYEVRETVSADEEGASG